MPAENSRLFLLPNRQIDNIILSEQKGRLYMKEFIVTIWFDVLDKNDFQDFVPQEKVARGNQWHTVRNMIDSFERGLENGSLYAVDSIVVKNLNQHA